MKWRLKRTSQCAKCPWRKSVDPRTIPRGYCERKHEGLASTIAKPADLSSLQSNTLRIMACHESHDAHCIGWLVNQIGVGNNLALRMHMMSCENGRSIKTIGEQHVRFTDTLPQ